MQRRVAGRVWALVFALVLIAIVGVLGWYFLIYTRSPGYALNQFFDAAKSNDSERLERYTDRSGMLMMLLQQMGDPVQLLYPGYQRQDIGKVEKVEVGAITVEGETAKATVTMEVASPQGQRRTMRPTYVLRKVEGHWKVNVQDTLCGSFNEFVPAAARQMAIRQLRSMVAQNPAMLPMARMQLQSLRAEIDKYPQFRDFLRSLGLY